PDLDDIVMTALAKTPEERWQSAGAMLRALEHVAKKLALQATNREVAEWVEWAFEQPLQSQRVEHHALRDTTRTLAIGQPALMSSTGPMQISALEQASIEEVWGNQAAKPAPTLLADDSRSQPVAAPPASHAAADR